MLLLINGLLAYAIASFTDYFGLSTAQARELCRARVWELRPDGRHV
jgi:hypothetical protein